MPHKYTDKDGNIVLAVSSSIPGVTFLPPGFNPEDAEHMSQIEFNHRHQSAKPPKDSMTNEQLTALVQKLQADIEKLSKTKTNPSQ